MNLAIEVNGLTKSYKTKSGDTIDAVKGIDLHVAEGEILAFLGSNGAGKTTTIEILEGFRDRTAGDVVGTRPRPANRTSVVAGRHRDRVARVSARCGSHGS